MSSETLKSIIVGTAATLTTANPALVEALTGTHPDRLAEEKRRGITIDLGFAFLEENGVRFGFVDVPGHDVSSATCLPAPRELTCYVGDCGGRIHQAADARAFRYLPAARSEARRCRVDQKRFVDADTLELVRLEAEEFLRGRSRTAPARSRQRENRRRTRRTEESISEAASDAFSKMRNSISGCRLDRAFAMKGFGSVVTGTLILEA